MAVDQDTSSRRERILFALGLGLDTTPLAAMTRNRAARAAGSLILAASLLACGSDVPTNAPGRTPASSNAPTLSASGASSSPATTPTVVPSLAPATAAWRQAA